MTASTPESFAPHRYTPLCDLLGITHPIVLGGMASATWVPLVAAVLNAANLGTLGTSGCSPDEMRDTTARLRDVTTAPFGRRKLAHADEETDARLVREIKQALPQLTVIRGRHTTHGNVARLLVEADGVFVGSCLQPDRWEGRVDVDRVHRASGQIAPAGSWQVDFTASLTHNSVERPSLAVYAKGHGQ
jgi:NAD(P)H-dependent flavin oxidoreductase YrpB (nitropropane dioxygenase family)